MDLKILYNAVDLYFDGGLSLRKISTVISRFVKSNHTAIIDWISKYQPQKLLSKTNKINESLQEKMKLIKIGSEYIWFWVAIELKDKFFLAD